MIFGQECLSAFKWIHDHFLVILWWAILFYSARSAFFRIFSRYKVSWFRPARCVWRSAESWDDVCLILRGDPLNPPRGVRGADIDRIAVDFLKVSALLAALSLSGYYIFDSHFPFRLEEDFSGGILSDSLIRVLAAIVVLAGVLYTAVTQLNAKVRSDNRQKWINDVRDTLADVVNEIPLHQPAAQKMSQPSPPNRARTRLELLLNPSERDHRTLGVLLRIAYDIPRIEVDRPIIDALPHLACIDPWSIGLSKNDRTARREQLITAIIRISNAMLKREWELVKYGK